MGEWSRETQWRQGSVFPDDAWEALGLSNPESPQHTLVVVISHDCDLAADPNREPHVIRAVLDGRQPRHLNLHALRGRQAEVPLDWDEQRRLFEFTAPSSPVTQQE